LLIVKCNIIICADAKNSTPVGDTQQDCEGEVFSIRYWVIFSSLGRLHHASPFTKSVDAFQCREIIINKYGPLF